MCSRFSQFDIWTQQRSSWRKEEEESASGGMLKSFFFYPHWNTTTGLNTLPPTLPLELHTLSLTLPPLLDSSTLCGVVYHVLCVHPIDRSWRRWRISLVRKKNKKATTYHEKLIKVFDECLVPRRGDFNSFDYIGKVGTILESYTIHLKTPKACHAFLFAANFVRYTPSC